MIDRQRRPGRTRPTATRLALALLLPLLVACGGSPTATAPAATTAPRVTAPAAPTSAAIASTPARPATTQPTTTPQPPRPATASPATTTTGPSATATRARATATGATSSGNTAQFARNGLAGTVLTALAVGGKDGQLLFAGGKGLWRSTDAGKKWSQVQNPAEAPKVAAIAIAPSDPQIVYVGVSEGCAKGGTLPGLVSTDGGASWRQSGENLSSITVDPREAKKVYATSCAGVQRSLDGGNTWETVSAAQLDNYTPTLIALAPRTPRTLYVAYASEGGTARVRRTSDDGATWQENTLPPQAFGPIALAVAPGNADTVLLSTLSGVFRSLNGGQTWDLLTTGLEETRLTGPATSSPEGLRLTTALVAAPNEADTFWLGTGSGRTGGIGIFSTHDSGTSWQRTGTGLDGRTIQALAVGVAGNTRTLYVATDDGVWSGNTP